MAKIIQMKDGNDNLCYPLAANRSWHYAGKLIDGTNTTIEGYGHADIQLMPNGIYRVDFSARITTADSSTTSIYTYGVDTSLFSSVVGKTITVVTAPRGNWLAIKTDGTLNYAAMGYGTAMNNNASYPQYANFARMYGTSSSQGYGGGGANYWSAGTILQGTFYGT